MCRNNLVFARVESQGFQHTLVLPYCVKTSDAVYISDNDRIILALVLKTEESSRFQRRAAPLRDVNQS